MVQIGIRLTLKMFLFLWDLAEMDDQKAQINTGFVDEEIFVEITCQCNWSNLKRFASSRNWFCIRHRCHFVSETISFVYIVMRNAFTRVLFHKVFVFDDQQFIRKDCFSFEYWFHLFDHPNISITSVLFVIRRCLYFDNCFYSDDPYFVLAIRPGRTRYKSKNLHLPFLVLKKSKKMRFICSIIQRMLLQKLSYWK
jgi:hypothetical protein